MGKRVFVFFKKCISRSADASMTRRLIKVYAFWQYSEHTQCVESKIYKIHNMKHHKHWKEISMTSSIRITDVMLSRGAAHIVYLIKDCLFVCLFVCVLRGKWGGMCSAACFDRRRLTTQYRRLRPFGVFAFSITFPWAKIYNANAFSNNFSHCPCNVSLALTKFDPLVTAAHDLYFVGVGDRT